MLLNTPSNTIQKLAENTRLLRLNRELTQAGLAKRAGIPLSTLRKFEQTGQISLLSFLKIQMVLGTLEDILKASEGKQTGFTSIDDVLAPTPKTRKRGKRT